MIEADVKKAVREFCKAKGAKCYMPVPTGFGERPVDFLICYRGRFIACETKRPNISKASALQTKFLYDVRQSGGYAIVENSIGLETLRAVFAAIENSAV